ncbi:MAG: hypothetical protein HC865_04435 [Cyanobacteria bacterium RU_5_0]|nr:hypothetical protein [Cyanobacteria bacterium RU_5_0]
MYTQVVESNPTPAEPPPNPQFWGTEPGTEPTKVPQNWGGFRGLDNVQSQPDRLVCTR